jgi:DNA repair exonuclease SbcCD nuclease subunit
MKKLFGIGDIHFNSSNPFQYKAGALFLKWFYEQDFGDKEDNEVIFVGDITEKDTNPGGTINQAYNLIQIAREKFKRIYILLGNHDLAKTPDNPQHSLMFLDNINEVSIIQNPIAFATENGFKVLALPFIRSIEKPLDEVYSELEDTIINRTYDVVAGHWHEAGSVPFLEGGVDTSKMKTDHWFLGHIHTRYNNKYLGSVKPNNIAEEETPLPRVIKYISRIGVGDADNEVEIEIPKFLTYKTATYPEELPPQKNDIVEVYTIEECQSLQQAKNLYEGYFIKGVVRPKHKNVQGNVQTEANDLVVYTDYKQAFNDMIKENDVKLDRKLFNYVSTLLTT